jgi:hypothetical protein
MATIDDKAFIDRLIAADGHYEDDPQILEICSYRTVEGKLTWSVAWTEADRTNLRTSPYVKEIEVIWRRKADRGFCIECGEPGDLDMMGCCSEECDIAYEAKNPGCCDGPED